ncbi:MAG TPA: hypothetical protein VFK05_37620 [Polyangiaceae bacterium]|nr:hypothetical protein [Polyangiaceae bacterium]
MTRRFSMRGPTKSLGRADSGIVVAGIYHVLGVRVASQSTQPFDLAGGRSRIVDESKKIGTADAL